MAELQVDAATRQVMDPSRNYLQRALLVLERGRVVAEKMFLAILHVLVDSGTVDDDAQ